MNLTPNRSSASLLWLGKLTWLSSPGTDWVSQVLIISLYTCHALKHRQILQNLTIYDSFVSASVDPTTSPFPCDLHSSLCTLRNLCSRLPQSKPPATFRRIRNTRYCWLVRPYEFIPLNSRQGLSPCKK